MLVALEKRGLAESSPEGAWRLSAAGLESLRPRVVNRSRILPRAKTGETFVVVH
jgi:hypothetical protein